MNQTLASTPIGTCLQERYVLQRVLGRGGMGSVYLARDQRLNKRVAVKELIAQTVDDEGRRKIEAQFHHEAHLLASLQHPGLVSISDYFSQDGSQYLVMEYVHGVTLDTLLNQIRGFPDPLHVLDWADQLCNVLNYLHGQSPPIIFRDLKPNNIMLDSDGRIRLIDFGIARIFDPNHSTTTIIRGAGTPGFAPLEQYGEGTDTRSDIYALGATLYSLLTRTLPPTAIKLVSGDDALIPPSSINPAVPPEFEAMIMRMMALRREDRYQSMSEVQVALERIRSPQRFNEDQTEAPAFGGRCTTCGTSLPQNAPSCPQCVKTTPQGSVVIERSSSHALVPRSGTARAGDDKLDLHIFVHTETAADTTRKPRRRSDTVRVRSEGSKTRRVKVQRRASVLDVWLAALLVCVILALSAQVGMQSLHSTADQSSVAALQVDTCKPASSLIHRVQVMSARLGDAGVIYILQDDTGQRYEASSPNLNLAVGQRFDHVYAQISKSGSPPRLTNLQLP